METLEIKEAATLEEIVFENRNKAYGAYPLRKEHDRRILLALLFCFFILANILLIPLVLSILEGRNAVVEEPKKELEEIAIIDVPLDPKSPEPPPLPKIDPPKLKTLKFVPPEIVEDEEVVEPPPPTQEDANKTLVSNETREGEDDSDGELPPDFETGKIGGLGNTIEDDQPWMGAVSKEVSFDGGYANYINKNIGQRLRNYINDRGIKGKIFFSVVIGKDGSVKTVEVLPGRDIPNCKMCSDDVMEIIKGMKWVPAEYNGNKVSRKITIPVVF